MTTTISPAAWTANAACGTHIDDSLWFDYSKWREQETVREARVVCGSCPVREACLATALADLSLEGIWAGTTLPQRRRIVRNRDKAAS